MSYNHLPTKNPTISERRSDMSERLTTTTREGNESNLVKKEQIAKELIVEQYKSLREEIQLHVNVQYTILGFMLLVIGTIVTIATQGQIGPQILMVYPILALFPALIWEANQTAIARIASFLRYRFEPHMDIEFRWEETLSTYGYRARIDTLYLWGIRGIFIGSQILMLIFAISLVILQYSRYGISIVTVILATADVMTILITSWILIDRSKKEDRNIEELAKGASESSIVLPTSRIRLYPYPKEASYVKHHSQNLSSKLLHERYFMNLLLESDQELMKRDFADICELLASSSNNEQEGLWTPALSKFIARVDPQELLSLEWATERHYGTLIRQATSRKELDYLYLIGYARVINLMMKIETHMGYSLDDLVFILSLLDKYIKIGDNNPKILDVGCGAGELLINLVECGYQNIVGIDIAPAAIRLAKRGLKERNLATENIHCTSLENFCTSFPDPQFDLIVQCHIIEHLPPTQVQQFLSQISQCLTPNGYMVVITPSKLTGPHDNTRFFRPHGVEPEGLHMQEYSLSELQQLLSLAGFGRFMAMNSLPYANNYWDTLSEENFQTKVRMEPFLESLEWKLRKPLVDGLYFQALACQKLEKL